MKEYGSGADSLWFEHCVYLNAMSESDRASITKQCTYKNRMHTLTGVLDPTEEAGGKLLRQEGYHTTVIGRWHLLEKLPGFDSWDVLQNRDSTVRRIRRKNRRGTDIP